MRPLQLVDFYVHINSKLTYTISILFKDKVFAFQNYPKNLDPSNKMDLDLWNCNLDPFYTMNLYLWDCFGRENPNLQLNYT